MSAAITVLIDVVRLYIIVLFVRLVLDYVQMFARSWTPKGPVLVLAEIVYTVTDPPLKALRRLIPPLRIGTVALDLSFLVLLAALYVGVSLLSSLSV
ncbi:YggT family protein [Motilibacter rhizosphaerae]|uniref:YggT family protein n=1 Tax=Motilibacter rhizosphaerae TaxID=598652 RepID=A0A4Q7NGF0_9ACTN|nr:YggT family protein [Motilibacter rhizosphaerae]RZS82905.1 YggT family protein [Motilibacter rhizosphaerae]